MALLSGFWRRALTGLQALSQKSTAKTNFRGFHNCVMDKKWRVIVAAIVLVAIGILWILGILKLDELSIIFTLISIIVTVLSLWPTDKKKIQEKLGNSSEATSTPRNTNVSGKKGGRKIEDKIGDFMWRLTVFLGGAKKNRGARYLVNWWGRLLPWLIIVAAVALVGAMIFFTTHSITDKIAAIRLADSLEQVRLDSLLRHPAEPEMIYVEGGTFWMGNSSSDADSNETPIHQVTLSNYYISKYEVTQAQWRALMSTSVAEQRDKVDTTWTLRGEGDNYPMYYVSWDEAQAFVGMLRSATGKEYALPTEAQWEFAARGGNKSRDYTYSGSNSIDEVAWYYGNSGYETHPVGTKLPNELGIYDMTGNVWEWCFDWYWTYPSWVQTDPVGPDIGSYCVQRGGSWWSSAQDCRSSFRGYYSPSNRQNNRGFRLVLLL
jgi:formylglycine-generating enzyme required for sulfatase activity